MSGPATAGGRPRAGRGARPRPLPGTHRASPATAGPAAPSAGTAHEGGSTPGPRARTAAAVRGRAASQQPQHPLWLELWPCTAVTRSIAFAGLLNQVHRCLHTRQMWLSPTKRAQLKDSYESCRSLQGDLACLPLPRTVTSDPGRESESFLPGPTRAPQSENQFRSDPRHDGCMVADGSSPTRRPNVPAASIRGLPSACCTQRRCALQQG